MSDMSEIVIFSSLFIIHHHFELSGFSEYKIVITFSLFALVMGILGLLLVLFV